ncbi:TetR family transcriptional regulator [Parvibaculum sp.]|uniref:TetR/AcrR family transcriptional regulator n=1 Tax=Parvibaculum sp. TaxID=2024848 RepID=UPI001DCCD989|nr:TetR family transcriptional regulator [Parvibaculum sp.]MBX3490149.1 TetR family transcriptional regulator [Parvibaculum sp.]
MKSQTANAAEAPPTEKGATRREEILAAATALLLEQGYAGFSARGVAARAGLRLSHVQYYFASPAAILAELLDRFVRRYGEEIMARFGAAKGSSEQRLHRALDFLLNDEAYRRDCGIFMIEVAGFAARDKVIAAALTRYYDIYFALFSDIAKTLNPALAPRERARRARQCIALIEGMSITRPHMGEAGDADFNAREATRAIMRLLSRE